MDPLELTPPICPILSTRSDVLEICITDKCAFYIAPVKKCALYMLGHKSAIEIQQLQKH